MAITPDVIANYIANILGGSGTDAEKAATINAAAQQYGVSREDINAATGYGMDVINAYLGPLSYFQSADDRQQDAIDAATVRPAETFQGGLSSISQPTMGDYSYGYTPQKDYTAPIDYSYGYQMESNDVALPATSNDFANVLSGNIDPPVSKVKQQQNLNFWEQQAIDAWNQQQAINAGFEPDQYRTMVSTYDDPYSGLPTVEVYMPGMGKSISVNARTAGVVSDDPTVNLNAAMSLVPQAQYALANNLDFLRDDKQIAAGVKAGTDTRLSAPVETLSFRDEDLAARKSAVNAYNASLYDVAPPVSDFEQQQNLRYWDAQAKYAQNNDPSYTSVSTYTDPNTGLPTVEIYMPSTGKSITVNAQTAGIVSDDPTTNLNAAMALVPQAQYALANNLNFLTDDTKIASGLQTGAGTQITAPTEVRAYGDRFVAKPTGALASVNYSDPIYTSAYVTGVFNRSDINDAEKAALINQYKTENNVSNKQIANAVGVSEDVVSSYLTPPTKAASTTTGALGTDTVTGGLGSATVKPVEAAGTYRGVPIPTFTDKYIDRGDEGTQILSAADQLASWKQNQDYLASLTPAQRAIQNAARTESQENALVTTYDPVTLGGKEWTVAGDGKTLIRLSDDQSGLAAKQTRYDVLDAATGQVAQQVGVEGPGLLKSFLTNPITGLILGLALPGVGQAIGSALGATGAAAGALGSGVLNFGLQVAAGAEPINALKGAVLSAGAGFVGTQVGSMLPAELASAGKNAVTQLITTGKLDPAALATSVGTSFATDTLAAETGLDKATAGKLVTAGLQAISGNELAALTSLAQAGIQSGLAGTNTTAQSPQDRAAFLEANASPLGLSALSPNASEDELISLEQRTNAANQLLRDYTSLNSDLSREGAVNQLTALGISAAKANELIANADSQVEQRRVATDVMSRYSRIDPEFGTPQLDRNTAVQEMVASGLSIDRANELLNGIDAQNAIKLENKLSVQSAYQNFVKGTGSEEALRSAMTSAGYTDADINNQVTRGRAIVEGGKLTAGEQAQQRGELLPDIRAEAAAKPTFAEAYALVRDKLGPGATFTWQGKEYVASSAAERPDLAGATTSTATTGATADLGTPYVAPNGMHNRAAFIAAGGGTSDADYAKYVNAVNSVISQGQSGTLIKPSSVNSTGKELPATTGAVTMETPKVGSVLGSVVAQGAANFAANSIAGPLSALGFTDAGATVLNKANAIASAAAAAQGEDITRGKQEINTAIDNVGKATNLKEAATSFGNVIYTAFKNPKAFAAEVGSEIVEEILQIGPLKGLPFWTREAIGSAVENGGAAYNQEYANQLQQGATVQDAHKNAQIAAGAASAASLAAIGVGNLAAKGVSVLTGAADDVIGGLLGKTKAVGKTTIKETIQEMGEEGLIAAAVDKAVRGETNPANILTGMAGGGLYAGPTSGTMQATGIDKLENAFDIPAQIKLSIDAGSNLATATKDVVASSLTGAINSGQDINTAASTIVVGALNAGSDPATVVNSVMDAGIKSGVDATAVINATVNSAISTGANTFTVIQTAVDTGIKSGADPSIVVTSSVNSAIKASASAAQNMGTTVDAIATSAVAAAVATATSTGANTTAIIKAATDAAASTGITVKVDTSTNGSVKTTTATTSNTSTSVSINTSNNTTVTITNDGNTSTKVVSTPTNTTTTTTDIKTGQSTTTTTNTATDQSATTGTTTNQSATTNTATDKNITTTNINAPPGTPSTGTPSIVAPPIVTTQQPGIIGETPITVGTTPIDLTPTIQGPTAAAPKTAATTTRTIPKTSPGMLGGAISGISLDNDWLKGQMLKAGKAEGYRDPLAQFQALQEESQKQEMLKQIDPELANVLAERGTPVTPYYSYGEEQPIEDVLGMGENKEEAPVFRSGGLVSPLNIQMMYAKGGRMREDFRHGKHVEGEGDGQSDDIPAWLADGEFVFPADVVSALGNGSTKAGTDMLYEMMHEIRKRARSKGPKDLPPPAHKSPLDYLKSRK